MDHLLAILVAMAAWTQEKNVMMEILMMLMAAIVNAKLKLAIYAALPPVDLLVALSSPARPVAMEFGLVQRSAMMGTRLPEMDALRTALLKLDLSALTLLCPRIYPQPLMLVP